MSEWVTQSGTLPPASSVLAVCAHPDDESFGLGAVLHQFVCAGAEVAVLCFTRGEASSLGRSDRDLSVVRRAELTEAAVALGIKTVALLDRPDGSLAEVALDELAGEVHTMAEESGADLILVFDEGGVTGHPDHRRATEAALAGAPDVPVLAWTLPEAVSGALNAEFGTGFVGRGGGDIDLVVRVERVEQREAIACHTSQSNDNPVLWRRLELLGEEESLRWLHRPASGERLGSESFRALCEEWDRRYAAVPRVFRADADESLVALVSPLRPGTAVDLGAGEGRNSLWLARQGWRVTAVDASQVALDRLSRSAAADGLSITTVKADIEEYLRETYPGQPAFDLVVIAYVHPDRVGRAGLLAAAANALGAGRHLFVVGHHLSSLGVAGPPDPDRLYTDEDLGAVPGVEVVSLEHREGKSDIDRPATDVLLWGVRAP
jgi:N-acetylglucosamine malate deacetylase 2